jgi:DNA sulfur modification protein DndD
VVAITWNAHRDMAAQVRRGIEGLLGLPVLRSLQESLQKYAVNRRSLVAAPSDQRVKEVQAEISRLDAELADARKKISEIDTLLPQLVSERDQLAAALASFGGGSVALVAELMKDEERLRAAADRALESLMQLISGDTAIALSGSSLRDETIGRLRAETLREQWETGRAQGSVGLDRFLARLTDQISRIVPALSEGQISAVVFEARQAWEALWHPPPEGCASSFLHSSLSGPTRAQSIARLESAGQLSRRSLLDLVRQMREASDGAEAKKRERLSLELNAPEADAKRARLQEVSEEIGRHKAAKETAERAAKAAEGQLAAKRQEFGRYTDAIGKGAAPLRRAGRAETVAVMIDDLLREAVPTQVTEVAAAMTDSWKAMARKKGLVDRIEITPECEVRLLNRHGDDLRDAQLSAGEEQIFTQALIHAIARVSARDFPFVVDTPLARLDEEHRLGVLRHFTDRAGQVILLSTDTEVVGPYLDAIRKRVLSAYRLSVRTDEGITVTSLEEGYFERI